VDRAASEVLATRRAANHATRRATLIEQGADLAAPLVHAGGTVVDALVGDMATVRAPWLGRVNLIPTSPPYNLGKDYGDSSDSLDYETEYLPQVDIWAAAMERALVDDGRLAVVEPVDTNLGGAPRPLGADWTKALQKAGLTYRVTITWAEGNISRSTARGSVDHPTGISIINPTEQIIIFSKGDWNQHRFGQPADLAHEDWLTWTNGLWTGLPGAHADLHPAPFPVELAERLIRLLSCQGDVIYDPFCGSGSTLVAAIRVGNRTAYGVDTNPEYVALTKARVAEALAAPAG